MKLRYIAIVGSIILGKILYSYFTHNNQNENIAYPVETTLIKEKTVPFIIELPARAEVYNTVAIKSLVTGQLEKINFKAGDDVKAGDVLFELDERNFKYQLDQANANLLKDQASLENAIQEEQRYKKLVTNKVVSLEQYQQILTNKNVLIAQIEGDKANIENAQLQLDNSKIKASIDGKLGEIFVNIGDIIQANNPTTMVIINQISPLYITFALPEKYVNEDKQKFEVIIKTNNGEEIKDGKIVFIDNNIDNTTNSLKLKALISNKDFKLWPGTFVKVLLKLYNEEQAIVIPTKAIQNNQDGAFVFVVNNNIAEIRKIKIKFTYGQEAVITEGLQKGEKIVTDGQIHLINGSRVKTNEYS